MKTIAKLKETNNTEVVFRVKGNQNKLLEKCVSLSQTAQPHSKTVELGKRERGTFEKRTVTVFHKDDYDLGDTWNEHINTIVRIERETNTFNTKTKQFDTSEEIAFYISIADELSAQKFGDIIREDFSRVGKNPENVATLRRFALNLLRINRDTNISQALYRNATPKAVLWMDQLEERAPSFTDFADNCVVAAEKVISEALEASLALLRKLAGWLVEIANRIQYRVEPAARAIREIEGLFRLFKVCVPGVLLLVLAWVHISWRSFWLYSALIYWAITWFASVKMKSE